MEIRGNIKDNNLIIEVIGRLSGDYANRAEQLIRVLIKDKIDQDQLINSGLSFDDVEKIIIAFKQVYAGVFHERIKYPE